MLPIHQIPFPHSPSPLPSFDMSLPQQQPAPYEGHADALGVPRFQKLNFPTFDGVDDPLGWLNKCDHFFRAQRTPEGDKVWLASFHMNGVAQQWYYMLERDYGDVSAISWPLFKALCYQRFGPALATNHLSDLARLPFDGSVQQYQEAFLARLAHAEPLTPMQQVRLFTGAYPNPSAPMWSCRGLLISSGPWDWPVHTSAARPPWCPWRPADHHAHRRDSSRWPC